MALPQPLRMTPDEYLAFERSSEERHEYIGGRVYAMSGASEDHNLIVVNITGQFYNNFRKRPCKVYAESMRVWSPTTKTYVYPDVVALCEKPQFSDDTFDTLTNPQVVIEVSSPSTQRYDKLTKSIHYRQIPSMQELLLVTQDMPYIAHYIRQDSGAWLTRDVIGLDASLTIAALDVTLALADVYEKVAFGDEG